MSTALLNLIANRTASIHESGDQRVKYARLRDDGTGDGEALLRAHAVDGLLDRIIGMAVISTNLTEDPRLPSLATWQEAKAQFVDQLRFHKVEPQRILCIMHPWVCAQIRAGIRAMSGEDVAAEVRPSDAPPEYQGTLEGIELYESSHVTPIHRLMVANLWIAIDGQGSPIEYHLPDEVVRKKTTIENDGAVEELPYLEIGPATVDLRGRPFEAWGRVRCWSTPGER
ncbi:hypothetical protein [Nannocystis sp. SCPEA4]|uniref:hypothetical protein n=1 Tax=Nannocystis sp. SCPEA4 TaxID=2996787 RepID=UPI00226EF83D|nr:hypothetical protein [Nannocystis sp. SCPEA4]MCY1055420.1 hypothetical protein [Nannocystis sp. SCPEA4]